MTAEKRAADDHVPDLGLFLENEAQRADSHQRYLIALIVAAMGGMYYFASRVQPALINDASLLVVGFGLGSAAFFLVGGRLVSRLFTVLQPRRMMYIANSLEAASVDSCVEAFDLPTSWRLQRIVPALVSLSISAMLTIAVQGGYRGWWILATGALFFGLNATGHLTSIFVTTRFARVQWATVMALNWELLGVTRGMESQDAHVKRILDLLKTSSLAPKPESIGWFWKAYRATGRASTTIEFAATAILSVFVAMGLIQEIGLVGFVETLGPVAALGFLLWVSTTAFLLVVLDPWKAHLGQLRFSSLVQAHSDRLIAVTYITLEGLRERQVFYDVPVGVIMSVIEAAGLAKRRDPVNRELPAAAGHG